MMVYNEKFKVQSAFCRPTFEDVTKQVKDIAARSGVQNGQVLVFTGHTTCSIQIQEFSDGKSYLGNELIMQDLANVMTKLVPTCESEHQYLHPCQAHVDIAGAERNEDPAWCLNTDAHLRSVIMGRSVTIPIIDGAVQLGDFGCIYFGDWDQIRARERTVIVQVMGE